MAFPVASAATATTFATSVTSMAVNLPASIVSGDLLIAYVAVRNSGVWTEPTGWTLLQEKSGGGSVGETCVWYRIANGTEGATATWTTGTLTTGAWQTRKVGQWRGSGEPEFISNNGDAVAVDPPSISPTVSSEDNLYLVLAGSSADTMTFSAAPANYSDLASTTASTGGSAANVGSAIRYLNTASIENPGAFTTSTNRWWACFTICVRPGTSGGGGGTPPMSNKQYLGFF